MNWKKYPSLFLVLTLLGGCDHPAAVKSAAVAGQTAAADSVQLLKLLKSVYRWHDRNQNPMDFDVIVADSFQTGLNHDSFNVSFNRLKRTNYFSAGFLGNYKKIADLVDDKLKKANPKLLNEINFSFQDVDPWTYLEDDIPSFWDRLRITDYRVNADSASLKWQFVTPNWSSEGYTMKFTRENSQWKVDYLEGFDPVQCLK